LNYSVLAVLVIICASFSLQPNDEWISLFDGKSLDGWKVGENSSTFSIEDGKIVVN
jgi:hypothetical protein